MRSRYLMLVAALVLYASFGNAQGSLPQRNVELGGGYVPGGGMDRTARSVERAATSR